MRLRDRCRGARRRRNQRSQHRLKEFRRCNLWRLRLSDDETLRGLFCPLRFQKQRARSDQLCRRCGAKCTWPALRLKRRPSAVECPASAAVSAPRAQTEAVMKRKLTLQVFHASLLLLRSDHNIVFAVVEPNTTRIVSHPQRARTSQILVVSYGA